MQRQRRLLMRQRTQIDTWRAAEAHGEDLLNVSAEPKRCRDGERFGRGGIRATPFVMWF